jgi:predicted RNA-binding Zn-ribbon protein involved in translation (DUF1610 family)
MRKKPAASAKRRGNVLTQNEGPVFFCDSCGAMVQGSAKTCPKCGKFFTSVRCPACNFSGESRLFFSGCPSCGYSVHVNAAPHPKRRSRQTTHAEGPPLWVYVVSALIFLAAVAGFVYYL